MARTSQGPRYYKSKRGWFANFGGDRLRLTTGPKKETEQEAKDKYEAEKQARMVETQGDRNTIWAVLNAYLADCENRVKGGDMADNTYRMHRHAISPFNRKFGLTAVRDLRPQHINDFLAEMRQPRWSEKKQRQVRWSNSTAELARKVLKTAFRWAVEEAGLISKSPFERVGRGKKQKRRRRRPTENRTAISDAEHQLLLEQAMRRSKKDFAHLLMFFYGTGARPAELYGATAAEWDEKKHAFIIKAAPENQGRYKLAYLGEDRIISVPPSLVPLAKGLMAKYPAGPIFRTESGRPWTNITLCSRFKSIKKAANRVAEKRGLPVVRKQVTAYSYRHGFVTRWIQQGKRLDVLCKLLNTSEAMVREHYNHLFEQTDTLKESLHEFDRDAQAQLAKATAPEPQAEPSRAS
jgi:integrase